MSTKKNTGKSREIRFVVPANVTLYQQPVLINKGVARRLNIPEGFPVFRTDQKSDPESQNLLGINIHRAGKSAESVKDWAIGCFKDVPMQKFANVELRYGSDLDFISRIKRDGSGTETPDPEHVKLLQNELFLIKSLSLTERTYIAMGFNSFVVRIKI